MRGQHQKRFTGVPRQLLDHQRVYMLAWVGTRWEVVAESEPLVVAVREGAPSAPERRASAAEAVGVLWTPVTPEEIRDRSSSPWSTSS